MSTPVEQIKEKLTIDEVIGSYIKLEGAGKNFKARCPFHNEKTPSFFISPDRGTYYCFGCQAKGDIFSFVEQFEGLDFMGALKLLAQRAGVELTFDKQDGAKRTEKDMLYAVMEEAAAWFEKQYALTPAATTYVASRGISPATRDMFRIGYAPEGWRNLYIYLQEKRFSDLILEKAGLAKKTEKGYYDRFRDRVMFPIMDSSGRVIAFSGRILHDDGKSAKYLNSPDTPLYNKSTVLYGIDKAKNEIRIKNYSILVEGQMDLVLSHQVGVKNTVAVSGTALTDSTENKDQAVNNLGLVRRLSPNIILAFDSDKAGRNAALRSAKIALELGMDVKIADLPQGKDPADLVLEDKAQWVESLKGAKPVVNFLIDSVLLEEKDMRKLPLVIAERVLPFIAEFQSSMQQAVAISDIHSKTGIPEDAIRQDLKKAIDKKRQEEREKRSAHAYQSRPQQPAAATPAPDAGAGALRRADTIMRKLFGLKFFLKDDSKAKQIEDVIIKVSGQEFYDKTQQELKAFENELSFEAEMQYASKKIDEEIKELLFHYELDCVKKRFAEAMTELSKAEKGKDEKKAGELISICQELSARLKKLTEQVPKT